MTPSRHPSRSRPPERGATPEAIRALRAALLEHYDRTRRDLPWRHESDPYRIWVSEVMLQQTRVETVVPYYRRWLGLFPDLESLARASRDDVLRAWQGLGYYRRARNLHAGARMVHEERGGVLPSDYDGLRALPGVGEYTAGAVASIAFGQSVPAVDGNVKRVLARLFDEPRPRAGWLRRAAAELLDPSRPGDWNQALMELGATVCTPRSPSCGACPWESLCAARAADTQEDRPESGPARAVPSQVFVTAVVADGGGRVLVERRPEGGLLGGMWSFPDRRLEGGAEPDEMAPGDVADVARTVAADAGAVLDDGAGAPRPLPPVRHRFTHLDATYRPVLLAGHGPAGENLRWVPADDPGAVALPVAQQKIASAAAAALADGSR